MKKFVAVFLSLFLFASMMLVACNKANDAEKALTDAPELDEKTAYVLGYSDEKENESNAPDGNITVIDAITMACRLHAQYNNTEVSERDANNTEIRFDFDDDSLVDTSGGRNARQKVGIVFGRSIGTFENGILTVTPDAPNKGGAFDPQIGFNKFNVDARDYDTVNVRMRVAERLPEVIEGVPTKNNIQFYFATSTSPGYDNSKIARAEFDVETEKEWFDIVLDMSENENWKDEITNFRFDPPENNGVYQLDYLVLSKNNENKTANWYDKYVDYAIKNDIMDDGQYYADDYDDFVTTAQLTELFARAIPEEHFTAINDIRGISDVDRNAKNSDVYLTLYRAGVLAGDENGNFNAASLVNISDAVSMISRIIYPEKRLGSTTNVNWDEQKNKFDLEFDNEADLEKISISADSAKIENGALVVEALDKGEGQPARFDTKLVCNNISVIAKRFSKLKVRFKADVVEDSGNTLFDFYFGTREDPTFTESKAVHADMFRSSYKDAFGWYILEIDLAVLEHWKGNVNSFRFDPTNADGTFVIDYIRFVKNDPLLDASHEKLLKEGYVATGLLQDPDFERGFYIAINDNSLGKDPKTHGRFTDYVEVEGEPLWEVGPYFTRVDLATNRDTEADKYTLTDTEGICTVKYNPDEKSITLRLNAVNNYQGEPHIDGKSAGGWWPHLLLNQGQGVLTGEERKKNGADADRIYMELDVRVLDYKDTINKSGHNSLTFPIFFYLKCDDAPNGKIWFGGGGIIHNNPKTDLQPAWTTDSAAHQYIYGVPMADVFDGMHNSFNIAPGVYATGEEWKHVRVDLTPHLERCIEWANRDNAYGVKVSKENLYFSGANIGFEIHGNYDCTVEFKNFNLISYRKGE